MLPDLCFQFVHLFASTNLNGGDNIISPSTVSAFIEPEPKAVRDHRCTSWPNGANVFPLDGSPRSS